VTSEHGRGGVAAIRAEASRLLLELHTLPNDPAIRRPVRDRLVELHMPLVEYLARRFAGRNEPLSDLVQVGVIGLLKSIDRFDPGRGLEFSTYATPTILGEIKRHFRDTGWLVHVPRRAQELQTTLSTARAELSQQLGRAPTVAELSARMPMPVCRWTPSPKTAPAGAKARSCRRSTSGSSRSSNGRCCGR
jgi:RNA polymerase sigma-B factor